MKKFNTSPAEMLRTLWLNKKLIYVLLKRQIESKYRGSVLGCFWSCLSPALMLLVYTFLFGVIFQARWDMSEVSKVEFAFVLFVGLIVFNIFSECLTQSPNMVTSNANYVKKVIFPLEILPFIILGSAVFQALISLGVWLLFYIVLIGIPHFTFLLFPLIIIPVLFISLGVSWIISSLGVYLRDLGQFVGIMVTILLFLSPIFYPVAAIPLNYQFLIKFNPLYIALEQSRDVLYWGNIPSWPAYCFYLFFSICFAWISFVCFQKMRKGFADVI